jgi:hypothetical protein
MRQPLFSSVKEEKSVTQRTLVSFDSWLDEIGISRTTGWRWRKAGFIKTVCIAGRLYLLHEEIETFTRRALAGEFERDGQSSTDFNDSRGYGSMPQHLARARKLVGQTARIY